jgi:hypothetical protein
MPDINLDRFFNRNCSFPLRQPFFVHYQGHLSELHPDCHPPAWTRPFVYNRKFTDIRNAHTSADGGATVHLYHSRGRYEVSVPPVQSAARMPG